MVLAASYVLLDNATRHFLEDSYAAQLQGSLCLVALDLQSRMGGVGDALREIAGSCGGHPGASVSGEAEEAARAPRRAGAVLVADDEEMVRATVAAALREAGHEVVEAGNGREVVETVLQNQSRFALIVLDIVMPVMDGREALRRLREQAPEVPVVVSTGYDPWGDDTLAAAGVLIKPFSIGEFLAKVSELLGEGPGAPPGGGTMAP